MRNPGSITRTPSGIASISVCSEPWAACSSETFGHLVEPRAELGELVLSARPGAHREIAGGQRAGGGGKLFEPAEDQPVRRGPEPRFEQHQHRHPEQRQHRRAPAHRGAHAGRIVIDDQEPVDRVVGHRAVAFMAARLVAHRVDAAQHLAPVVEREKRGVLVAGAHRAVEIAVFERVEKPARIGREPDFARRVGDHHPGDVLLRPESGDDILQPVEIALDHRVLERRLQQHVHVERGRLVGVEDAAAVLAGDEDQKQAGGEQDEESRDQRELTLEAAPRPARDAVPGARGAHGRTWNSFL